MKKNNKDILISIIIPVYNSEKHIAECLNSIVSQTFENYEIIIVNDGSKDNSLKICNSYKSNNIHVITQENKGVSEARNLGMKKSIGKYIMFLDSDDFLSNENCLKIISDSLKYKPDLLIYKMKYFYEKCNKIVELPNRIIIDSKDNYDILNKLVKQNSLSVSPCDKIIKKDIIINNELFFDSIFKNLEDVDWSLKIYIEMLKKKLNIKIINDNIYVYRKVSEGSASTKFTNEFLKNYEIFFEKWSCYKDDSKTNKFISNSIAYYYIIYIATVKKMGLYKDKINIIKSYKYLLKYNMCLKVKLVYVINKIFGMHITLVLLNYYLNKRIQGKV